MRAARNAPNTVSVEPGPAQVEIFFSILYRRLLKHGAFFSEEDLSEQMLAFIETYNQTARPFTGTCTGKLLEA